MYTLCGLEARQSCARALAGQLFPRPAARGQGERGEHVEGQEVSHAADGSVNNFPESTYSSAT